VLAIWGLACKREFRSLGILPGTRYSAANLFPMAGFITISVKVPSQVSFSIVLSLILAMLYPIYVVLTYCSGDLLFGDTHLYCLGTLTFIVWGHSHLVVVIVQLRKLCVPRGLSSGDPGDTGMCVPRGSPGI
jgi:hypothetical protein